MRRPLPFALAALLALSATAGCQAAAPPAVAPAPPFVDGRDAGDAQLVLTPDLGGPRTLLASAANVRANIDHVTLTLKRGTTAVATYEVPKARLDDAIVFGNLRSATTYTVLAAAYRDAAGTDLMSDAAASQVTVTLAAGFVQPTVARIPVRLTDVTFAGMASAALAITDGLVGVDQPLAIARSTWTAGTLAGDLAGHASGSADGPGRVARFNGPDRIAYLPTGSLLVKDTGNDRLRVVSPAGDVTSVPGSSGVDNVWAFAPLPWNGFGPPPFVAAHNNQIQRWVPNADGTGYDAPIALVGNAASGYVEGDALTTARLASVLDLELLPNGDILFLDGGAQAIRKYAAATKLVSTVAGSNNNGATKRAYVDAVGTLAAFNDIESFATAPDGTIYVADSENHRIRKIAPDRTVTTFAGSASGYQDGVGTAARFKSPIQIQRDALGNLYVVDAFIRVRRIAPDQKVTTVAGSTGTEQGSVDGAGTAARFERIAMTAIAPDGTLYLTDYVHHLIRVVK